MRQLNRIRNGQNYWLQMEVRSIKKYLNSKNKNIDTDIEYKKARRKSLLFPVSD